MHRLMRRRRRDACEKKRRMCVCQCVENKLVCCCVDFLVQHNTFSLGNRLARTTGISAAQLRGSDGPMALSGDVS